MVFYRHFYIVSCFIQLFIQVSGIDDISIMDSGLDTVNPSTVGLQFFAIVNNTSDTDFEIELNPDECCLNVEPNLDCDVLEILGDIVERIPRGTTKTLKMVAPLLDPFERYGYCIFYLDSKPNNRKRDIKRTPVKITFDTRLRNNKHSMEIPDTIKICGKLDEDPLNECKPVDCDTYYNGKRSYYSERLKRCIDVPKCISDSINDIPALIYNPDSNKCVKQESITKDDMNFVKILSNGKRRQAKDILIIQNMHKTESPKHSLEKSKSKLIADSSLLKEGHIAVDKIKIDAVKNLSDIKSTVKQYISINKLTLSVLGIVILIQCCLICTMIYCLSKNCQCCNKKKVVRQLFNYRQDASVTTPLIGTSNIDTETTEFQYMNESSNIDKKIKCYKACHKEWKDHVKMSMSDDILSKCLTRRDWNRKPDKPEAIPETDAANFDIISKYNELQDEDFNVHNKETVSDKSKKSDVKVNFENETSKCNEKDKKSSKLVRSIVKNIENKSKDKNKRNEHPESQRDMSEKEIKCHSYNYDYNVTGLQPSTHSKHLGSYKTDKTKKGTLSVPTEKGAQAAFTDESIDDFLSGRGMLCLAGENLSKYSIFSGSNFKKSSTSSDVSSKTPKNNIVKNLLSSLFNRRSKHGPASDPGNKKPSENFDVEILHDMSHTSIYSSSNNDSDYIKSFKKTKDSRTSL
ncbi:uncharacterized protein ACR2FA_010610 [Aphomia sociella]